MIRFGSRPPDTAELTVVAAHPRGPSFISREVYDPSGRRAPWAKLVVSVVRVVRRAPTTASVPTPDPLIGVAALVGEARADRLDRLVRALRRADEREQFGRPLAKFQLIQSAIAEVAGNLAATSGLMLQVDALRQEGRMEMMHAAMAKATSTRLARSSAALARDALGGNGLLTEHEIAKIMGDVEAIYSYEGTYAINSLIVARALTGVSAFR